jgi:hypothetical protein
LIFDRDGEPNVKFMDGTKSQVEGEVRRKLRDDDCNIKQKESHIQSSTMGEGAVCKLKRGVGRQIIRSGCPKLVWDDSIIREVYVLSHKRSIYYWRKIKSLRAS